MNNVTTDFVQLDSTSSLLVLDALKKVASEGGITIVAVIHQPRFEIFSSFDDVLLLGKGGRTVFIGESSAAQASNLVIVLC